MAGGGLKDIGKTPGYLQKVPGQYLETFKRNRMSQYLLLLGGVQRCRGEVQLLHFTL